jgi:hypothetical protein
MPSKKMPWSVRVAAGALVLVVLVQIAIVVLFRAAGQVGWARFLFAAALVAYLVTGILRGRRLAWLWGRYLGFFLSAATIGGMIVQGRTTPPAAAAVVLLGFALPLVTASVALGRRSAFEWFGLVCPACGAATSRGDFLMRRARCGACGEVF